MQEERVDRSLLDDQARLQKADPSDMLGAVESLPEQCRNAVAIARSAELPSWSDFDHVVVLGMGGSAIGGDFVRALLEPSLQVPMAVNRDYSIPGYVGSRSLVIASSYSGGTEETLAAHELASQRGARVLAITTGGELAQRAEAAGQPVVRIPGGLQPRAAVGYALFPLLIALSRLGLFTEPQSAIDEAIAVLAAQRDRFQRAVPAARNPAKSLAAELMGRAPLVLGGGGWKGVVAYRWKCQFNENAKSLAFSNQFPELNHNETCGWEAPEGLTSRVAAILLRDRSDDQRMQTRVDVTKAIVAERAATVAELWAEGESDLARMVSLIYPGDFASAYLALLYGIDPTPVRMIDRLKAELARLG